MCNKCEALNRNTGKFINVPDMPILILLVLLELLDNKAIIFKTLQYPIIGMHV